MHNGTGSKLQYEKHGRRRKEREELEAHRAEWCRCAARSRTRTVRSGSACPPSGAASAGPHSRRDARRRATRGCPTGSGSRGGRATAARPAHRLLLLLRRRPVRRTACGARRDSRCAGARRTRARAAAAGSGPARPSRARRGTRARTSSGSRGARRARPTRRRSLRPCRARAPPTSAASDARRAPPTADSCATAASATAAPPRTARTQPDVERKIKVCL